jgi:hypothetical protein
MPNPREQAADTSHARKARSLLDQAAARDAHGLAQQIGVASPTTSIGDGTSAPATWKRKCMPRASKGPDRER